MSEGARVIRSLMIVGAVLSGYVNVRMMTEDYSDGFVWTITGALGLLATVASVWGIWRWRRWALWASWVAAASVFILGCFGAAFHWSFWLFYTPTLKERFLAVLNWQVIPLLLGPLFWVAYVMRPSVRARFH